MITRFSMPSPSFAGLKAEARRHIESIHHDGLLRFTVKGGTVEPSPAKSKKFGGTWATQLIR